MNTKAFSFRTLLTVTTDRLFTKPTKDGNGIEDLYKLLAWMTGEDPFTHQLGRFAEECKPWLFRWFPELVEVNAKLPEKFNHPEIERWLNGLGLPRTYDVPKIPMDDHTKIDPREELKSMTDKPIVEVMLNPRRTG